MIKKIHDYVSSKEQVPRATCFGSRARDARVRITYLAYSIIADISAIYKAIQEILKILVGPHVVSKHANFWDDPSMYAAVAPKIRGRRRVFHISFCWDAR